MADKKDIKFDIEITENISAVEVEKSHIGSVNIWITGSGAINGKEGRFRYILQYKDAKKYEEKIMPGVTANQAYIYGAIHAVKCINKSCKICIIVPTALGFEMALKGKGANVDLIHILYDEIVKRGCELIEVRFINGAQEIKTYIANNSGKNSLIEELQKKDIEKEDRKLQYKKAIYRECLEKVCRVLKKEGVMDEILEKINEIQPCSDKRKGSVCGKQEN